MELIREQIGTRIRELREEKGLSQEKLSELADVGLRTITNIEKGSFSVKIDTLYKIVKVLNSTIEIKKAD